MKTEKPVMAWWATALIYPNGRRRLGFGDGRIVKIGRTHRVTGTLRTCDNGLHGTELPHRALEFASYTRGDARVRGDGARETFQDQEGYYLLYQVELGGEVQFGLGKIIARSRKYLRSYRIPTKSIWGKYDTRLKAAIEQIIQAKDAEARGAG